MKTKVKTKTEIKDKNIITLTKEDIIEFLRMKQKNVPDNAEVSFDVPSGGDYSGVTLDIDSDNPITVTYDVI